MEANGVSDPAGPATRFVARTMHKCGHRRDSGTCIRARLSASVARSQLTLQLRNTRRRRTRRLVDDLSQRWPSIDRSKTTDLFLPFPLLPLCFSFHRYDANGGDPRKNPRAARGASRIFNRSATDTRRLPGKRKWHHRSRVKWMGVLCNIFAYAKTKKRTLQRAEES